MQLQALTQQVKVTQHETKVTKKMGDGRAIDVHFSKAFDKILHDRLVHRARDLSCVDKLESNLDAEGTSG